MPIFVNCVCGKRLQGQDQDAGRQTRCPYCGNILTLPHAAPSQPAETWNAPAPAPPAPMPMTRYNCRVCGQSFAVHEVYSEGNTVICKRCHEFGPERTEEPKPEVAPTDRWAHLNLPGKPKVAEPRRPRDDEEEEY